MASRRIALSAALRGCSSSSSTAAATTPPRVLRATFATASSPSTLQQAATTTKSRMTTIARPVVVGRGSAAHRGGARSLGVRWSSSDTPPGTKIWSFEEIQALTSTPPSSSPSSKPRVTLIDVREPSELAQTGRIPGALNVPVASAPDSFHVPPDEFEDRYGVPRPDPAGSELVFYCKAGVRSRAAATIAREAGYANVGEYPGSWIDWVERGGKVER
ncbi:Rhodanese-like protein [Hypoxylon rubiginosum]|uniref:Rhodanese-like protein n=1 Tax=Hypoxylon rubiginosum TaxID=110542 RepID=A0ACB9Z2F3_9PEZI|nr:Rhodanese-like protein [Hypoxylon rubiginosum]